MASIPVINLRRGQAVRHNGDVCIISGMEHKTPPRMASYVQMSIRSISTGNVHNLRLTSNESLEGVNLTREDYEYSYKDSSGYHFLAHFDLRRRLRVGNPRGPRERLSD